MNSMNALTRRQQQVFEFIQDRQRTGGVTPTMREIARHFGFSSMTAAMDHVRAIRRKGLLEYRPRLARSLRVVSPLQKLRKPVVDIPIFGFVPAGFPTDQAQQAEGCISVDVDSLGIRPGSRTFALQVRGDSMIGKHIMDGDFVVCEHGVTPRLGQVVAALIDNETTLKTFLVQDGKPFLRAENPRYPRLIPAAELVIQGVMVALIRKRQ